MEEKTAGTGLVSIPDDTELLRPFSPVYFADTIEIAPREKNYEKSGVRPSLNSLWFGQKGRGSLRRTNSYLDDDISDEGYKFGTFDGVLARCLLCIWGVIMYLRTGWIVGEAGIWHTTIIMLLASSVTTLTSLSLSAICTNGEVQSGGYYFLISRSLGPEFGGVIGLLFAFANCISVAMYLTGFAETVTSLYEGSLTGGWDLQLWGEIALTLMMLLALRGVGSVIKFDMVLLVFLLVSLVTFFIGTFILQPNATIGFTGYSSATLASNMNPQYSPGETFISVFSIFFPAVTGEMAGANISGDLRNPSYSIPVGTMSAIFISTVVYILIAWVLGATMLRTVGTAKEYGLKYDYTIMIRVSAWGPLVIIGIFASTLSSGMSCFVGAPRIFQAICQDDLFPKLRFFAKGRDSDGEPVRATLIVYVISFLAILTGSINIIAPIITNFFLITYCFMNYSCFLWSFTRAPGWRPTFKYYHPYMSLLASAQCLVLMFAIDWIMALITVCIGVLVFKYIEYLKPSVNWGTASEAMVYTDMVRNILKYQHIQPHAKVARPTFLFFRKQSRREVMATYQLAQALNACKGLIILGDVVVGDADSIYSRDMTSYSRLGSNLQKEIFDNALVESLVAKNFNDGFRIILQTAGIGILRPNVTLFTICESALDVTVNKIEESHASERTMSEGFGVHLDVSSTDLSVTPSQRQQPSESPSKSHAIDIDENFIQNVKDALRLGSGVCILKGTVDWRESHTGRIDIWWLFDDGGLTLLVPHLLSLNRQWKNCSLRVMVLDNGDVAYANTLMQLMKRLRITADVCVVDENTEDASVMNETSKFRCDEEKDVDSMIHRKLRQYHKIGCSIRNLSEDAELVVITLPFPRQEYGLLDYARLLQKLSVPDKPVLYVRGNQDQVLTFEL